LCVVAVSGGVLQLEPGVAPQLGEEQWLRDVEQVRRAGVEALDVEQVPSVEVEALVVAPEPFDVEPVQYALVAALDAAFEWGAVGVAVLAVAVAASDGFPVQGAAPVAALGAAVAVSVASAPAYGAAYCSECRVDCPALVCQAGCCLLVHQVGCCYSSVRWAGCRVWVEHWQELAQCAEQ